MSLINYTTILNIFKKRFKIFVILNLIFYIFFVLSNQTIFKDKLDKKFSVIFDYKYDYIWSDGNSKSFEFDSILSKLKYEETNSLSYRPENTFPFEDLKELHSVYFALLYEFNHNDIKDMDFKSQYNKIGQSFNFDTRNVTYRNKKLHVGWNNLEEAENYLLSLHNRSVKNIQRVLNLNLNDKKNSVEKKINNFLKIYSLNDMKKSLLILLDKENGIDGIDGKETELFINEKIKLAGIEEMQGSEIIGYLLSNNVNFVDYDLFNKKKTLFAYYVKKKYMNDIDIDELNYFYEYENLIKNIKDYLPKYNKEISKLNYMQLYAVEIIISFILSLIIIFFPKKLRKKY